MVEFLMHFILVAAAFFASCILLSAYCGIIFTSYFNARKKYIKEINFHDTTDGE